MKHPGPGQMPPRWTAAGLLTLGLFLTLVVGLSSCRKKDAVPTEDLFTVKRGNLDITVIETGNLKAYESSNIINEVPQTLKIVQLIEEGATITKKDVEDGRILVKLDSSNLEDAAHQRESELETARAALTEATESLAIQKSDNQNSIRAAELNITYARNDLRKLVGDVLAEKVTKEKLGEDAASIRALLDSPDLGGQSKQDLRQLRSDIELAQIKVSRAKEKLEYTRKLHQKQYVSKNELETDELAVKTQETSLQSAQAKLEIFRRYDFVKNFQKTWETVLEAQQKLARAQAVARSRLAQAEAKLRSRESAFQRAQQRLKELRDHIEKCTIRATEPGFVIYQAQNRYRSSGPIREGSDIRPQQTILQLPDLSRMAVMVKIHEAQIDMVAVGQKATISIEAIPNVTFTGKVTKKAVIPSSQSRWLNPDLKVYETTVLIDGENKTLRPGMTATVEILSDRLENVLYIPVQAVRTNDDGSHTVFRRDGTPATVTLGRRNRIFVVVEQGLEEGDVIRMTPPKTMTAKKTMP